MQSNIRLLNKSKVCESCFCVGAVGSTESSAGLLRWMICGPEWSRCVNEFEASLACNNYDEWEEECEDANSKHHEQNKSLQNWFGCQVLNLVKVISNMGNPFKEQSLDLLVLYTHDIKDKDVLNTVNSIETLGKSQFQEFLQSRIKTKQMSIFEPIKRNKLPLFSFVKTKKRAKHQSQAAMLKKNFQLFHSSTLLARFKMVTLTSFSAMKTKRFVYLNQKIACYVVVINQIFYPLLMIYKILHSMNPLSNALLLMDQLLLISWHLWIAQPSKIIQRNCFSHLSYRNFNQVVEELTLFGMFIWRIALKNLQELKEVKVFVAVYYKNWNSKQLACISSCWSEQNWIIHISRSWNKSTSNWRIGDSNWREICSI